MRHYGDDASVTMLARSSALILLLLSTYSKPDVYVCRLIACTSHFGALHAADLAQVTFLTQLHDATVVEGGNAYSILPNQTTTVLEGEDITYTFGLDANPTPTNFTWYRDGQVIPSGGRIAISVSTISITSTTRSDSGMYEVVSYNEAGRGAANFTLEVQCEPSLSCMMKRCNAL